MGGQPSPHPPCAFLRRHPAQQVPLHRRPGGDPAPERVGAPVQQVRCCGQPPPETPAPGGKGEWGRGSGPHGAVAGPSSGSSCMDGDAVGGHPRALPVTEGSRLAQQSQPVGLSQVVLGVLAAGRLAGTAPPPPCPAQVAQGAWALPVQVHQGQEPVALLRTCAGPGRRSRAGRVCHSLEGGVRQVRRERPWGSGCPGLCGSGFAPATCRSGGWERTPQEMHPKPCGLHAPTCSRVYSPPDVSSGSSRAL